MLARLANETFDVLVVGGGATGLGCAVDAVSRGYRTALIEAADFASATSSRSTKLAHGGVRYLQQGNVHLVREALHERSNLHRNAPHTVRDLAFLTPAYRWFEAPYYATGLKLYDLLAGRDDDFGRSRYVCASSALSRLPWLRSDGLRAAVEYHDGQFDDARLAVALARTAADRGAALANYARCIGLQNGPACTVRDEETQTEFSIRARVIVNATGIFTDALRRMDDPQAVPILELSRGTHLVLAPGMLPGAEALLIPKTRDGRVIFAIPWYGRTLVGTTDIPASSAALDPQPTAAEIAYLLETLAPYVEGRVGEESIAASFAGLRPLVKRGATPATAKLSREHLVEVSATGMVTIAGGKWTTYRKMAEDAIDAAVARTGLAASPCVTARLRLHDDSSQEIEALVTARPELATPLWTGLPYTLADVVNAYRNEMARTARDVIERRTRIGFLDARAAEASRATVEGLLATERALGPSAPRA
jgi:glycerol-3-phosphate dehydrogenase